MQVLNERESYLLSKVQEVERDKLSVIERQREQCLSVLENMRAASRRAHQALADEDPTTWLDQGRSVSLSPSCTYGCVSVGGLCCLKSLLMRILLPSLIRVGACVLLIYIMFLPMHRFCMLTPLSWKEFMNACQAKRYLYHQDCFLMHKYVVSLTRKHVVMSHFSEED